MRRALSQTRLRLAVVVWAVLVSQVLVYPGLDGLLVALGAAGEIQAGMWFLLAEFGAFVAFAVVWGAASDALGRRTPLVVAGAVGGAASYLVLTLLPTLGFGFHGALVVRAVGGAFSIGAFSLAITMLMDLSGGNGRNMGAAGIAIGLGAALGSVLGGQLSTVDPFGPIYAGAAVLAAGGLLAGTIDETTAPTGSNPPVGSAPPSARFGRGHRSASPMRSASSTDSPRASSRSSASFISARCSVSTLLASASRWRCSFCPSRCCSIRSARCLTGSGGSSRLSAVRLAMGWRLSESALLGALRWRWR